MESSSFYLKAQETIQDLTEQLTELTKFRDLYEQQKLSEEDQKRQVQFIFIFDFRYFLLILDTKLLI